MELDPTADEWLNNDRTTGWEKNALQHPDMMGELDCDLAHSKIRAFIIIMGLPIGLYKGEGRLPHGTLGQEFTRFGENSPARVW